MRLSIIIPVYNVEQYLRKCLDSVLQQDIPHEEYEVIVVNDGSPDGSLAIAKEYAYKYSNVKVESRPNGGLSAARNTGLEHAQGEYVWFVDSDDWVEPNSIGVLLDYAEKNELDVQCFNLQLAFEDGRLEKYNVSYEESVHIYKGEEFLCKVGMPPAAWAALYKREFLQQNNLKFYEGILHEDQEFTPRAYYLAERIAYNNRIVYNYFQRQGGIMRSNRSSKRSMDLLIIADSLYVFTQDRVNKNTDAYRIFIEKVNFLFSQSLAYYSKSYFPITKYIEKPYYPLKYANSWKYRLMNFSLKLYLTIYKLKK